MQAPNDLDVEKLRDEYQRNGACCVRDFLSQEWLDKITDVVRKVMEDPSSDAYQVCYMGGKGAHFSDVGNFERVAEIRDVVLNSPLASLTATFTGSKNVAFYHDRVIVREPYDREIVPYQREMSQYPFEGNQGCSVWIPVDKICLEATPKFVVGSHLWGKKYLPVDASVDENTIGDLEKVPDIRTIKDAMIMEWNMSPGDLIFYNMKTLMSSNGNATSNPHRILVLHFLGDDIRVEHRNWPVTESINSNLKDGDRPADDLARFPVVFTSK